MMTKMITDLVCSQCDAKLPHADMESYPILCSYAARIAQRGRSTEDRERAYRCAAGLLPIGGNLLKSEKVTRRSTLYTAWNFTAIHYLAAVKSLLSSPDWRDIAIETSIAEDGWLTVDRTREAEVSLRSPLPAPPKPVEERPINIIKSAQETLMALQEEVENP
jgi:hypothetical protein